MIHAPGFCLQSLCCGSCFGSYFQNLVAYKLGHYVTKILWKCLQQISLQINLASWVIATWIYFVLILIYITIFGVGAIFLCEVDSCNFLMTCVTTQQCFYTFSCFCWRQASFKIWKTLLNHFAYEIKILLDPPYTWHLGLWTIQLMLNS